MPEAACSYHVENAALFSCGGRSKVRQAEVLEDTTGITFLWF